MSCKSSVAMATGYSPASHVLSAAAAANRVSAFVFHAHVSFYLPWPVVIFTCFSILSLCFHYTLFPGFHLRFHLSVCSVVIHIPPLYPRMSPSQKRSGRGRPKQFEQTVMSSTCDCKLTQFFNRIF
jgi:hypothetical protein